MKIKTTQLQKTENKLLRFLILVLSIAIPVVVSLLFYLRGDKAEGNIDVSFLPHLNAVLNSGTAISIIIGYYFIKKGNRESHKVAMLTAFTLSSLFLVSYVLYHFYGGHTKFGDLDGDGIVSEIELAKGGILRYVYLILLLTHILMAAIVVPFVLFSVYLGLTRDFVKHKKVSKWTFPIWLYVAITGVLVYLLITPYYQ
jgi:putative membrane protein